MAIILVVACLGCMLWLRLNVDLATRDILNIYILGLIVACGLIIALTVWLSLRQRQQILQPIQQLINATQQSLQNDVTEYVDVTSDDELGSLADAYNQMLHVRKVVEELKNLNQQLACENTEKSLLNEISNLLRDIDVISEFAEKVIDFFVVHQSVLLGFFYYFDAEVSLLATYGLSDEELVKKKKSLMSGLLTECENRQKVIVIDSLPEGYFKVSSGVGDVLPKQVLLLPLVFENKVLAVIELGLLKPLSETSFLDNLCREMAIQLNILTSKLQLKELLENTEQQRKYLQVQKQELSSSNEELRLKTDVLQQSEEALNVTNEELYTQIKLIEEQKQSIVHQKQEIEKSSQYKPEFLANMSHELRTPLNILLILAQSLKENEAGNLNQEQVEEANIIYESGQDLLELINDVLDISKIASGTFEINLQTVDFSEFIVSLNNQFTPLAKQKGIDFTIITDETIPAEIKADPIRLSQVLKNLLGNAIKFTDEGRVHLKIFLAGESLFFEVKDTGIGIAKEMQELIFEEFKQVDGSTSRKYGGTGLGLSISRKLSGLMNGNLVLQSNLGEGAIFTLDIPLIKAEDNELLTRDLFNLQVPSAEYSCKDRVTRKLLLVDDDLRNTSALSKVLEAKGLEVQIADNGALAMDKLATSDVDLILMDMMMPVMDGYEAIEKIRTMSIYQNIPIIALTVKASHVDKEKCLAAGANDYMSKPINIDKLLDMITFWLN